MRFRLTPARAYYSYYITQKWETPVLRETKAQIFSPGLVLKCKNHVLVFLLFFDTSASCTSAVFFISPEQIVAGTDRLTNDLTRGEKAINSKPAVKIVLLGGRFIVACVGLEAAKSSEGVVTYDFPEWTKTIESQIAPETSLLQLVGIIEKESSRTLKSTVGIEEMMKSGAVKNSETLNRFLVQYLVAGFEHRVPTLIQVFYELDWQNNRLIGPTKEIEIPNNGVSQGLYTSGKTCAFGGLKNIRSYAYKKMLRLNPATFKQFVALNNLPAKASIRIVRDLIDIEAEIEPDDVGNGSIIVRLPVSGEASITQYEASEGLTKARRTTTKNKP